MRFVIHPTNKGASRCVRCGVRKNPYDGEIMCQHCLGVHESGNHRPFGGSTWFVKP